MSICRTFLPSFSSPARCQKMSCDPHSNPRIIVANTGVSRQRPLPDSIAEVRAMTPHEFHHNWHGQRQSSRYFSDPSFLDVSSASRTFSRRCIQKRFHQDHDALIAFTVLVILEVLAVAFWIHPLITSASAAGALLIFISMRALRRIVLYIPNRAAGRLSGHRSHLFLGTHSHRL